MKFEVTKDNIWRDKQIVENAYYIAGKADTCVALIHASIDRVLKDFKCDNFDQHVEKNINSRKLYTLVDNEFRGMLMFAYNIGVGAGINASIKEIEDGLSV